MKNHLFSKLGVPVEIVEKLLKMGVHTAEDLFKKANTRKRRMMLSQLLHIPEKQIIQWVNRLDFLRLRNMTHEMSEMFHKMGFETIASLRNLSSKALHKEINIFNLKHKHLNSNSIPSLKDVKDWIKQSESLELKILGFKIPKIHRKLKKKPEPEFKIPLKDILLYILGGVLLIGGIFFMIKNIPWIKWVLGFAPICLGGYLRFGKDPFPKIRSKIQDFLTITSKKVKEKNQKLSFKLDEINRKFNFYRKQVGTLLIILPIIIGILYMININTKFLDLSRFLPQKNIENQKVIGFKDVTEDDSYFEAVKFLNENKIIEGYEDQTFRPKEPIKRGELVKILVSSLELKDKEIYKFKNCFPDVKTDWFAPFICYAEEQSWVHGYSDKNFKPENSVTKAESLKMMLNIFEINNVASVTEDVFPDVKSHDWFAPFVQYAKESKIIELDEKENFKPYKSITRGEVSAYIYRVMKKLELRKTKPNS